MVLLELSYFVISEWPVFDIVCFCGLFLSQTFQKAKDCEEAKWELSEDEKSPLVKSLSQSSLHRRKSIRGSSFAASEGEKEVQKLQDHAIEEVSCGATSLEFEWLGQHCQHGLCKLNQIIYSHSPTPPLP